VIFSTMSMSAFLSIPAVDQQAGVNQTAIPVQKASPTPTSPAGKQVGVIPTSASGAQPLEVFANFTPTPFPQVGSYTKSASFTFKDIGQAPIVLRYPNQIAMSISFPNQWNISYPQSDLTIHYDLTEEAIGTTTLATVDPNKKPFAEIYINGFSAGTFDPIIGYDNVVKVKWPDALLSQRESNLNPLNNYTITFAYVLGVGENLSTWCNRWTLTIRDSSIINMSFQRAPVFRNLADFPRPLVEDSFLPETLFIVVPDAYSENDLAEVSMLSSTIARNTTSRNIAFNVIKASEATPLKMANSNAILIGKPGDNSFIRNLYQSGVMPTTYNGKAITEAGDNDGVLNLIATPGDTTHTFLIVTGNSDKGILKAVQALGGSLVGLYGNVFIAKNDAQSAAVSKSQENKIAGQVNDSIMTFADMDFTGGQIFGYGSTVQYIDFYLPRNWDIQDGSKLVINYGHGIHLADPVSDSVMNVTVNGVAVAGAKIDHTQVGENQLIIPLQGNQLLPGSRNAIQIEFVIAPINACTWIDPRSTWVAVRDTSFLYVKYKEKTTGDTAGLPSLITNPLYHLANESTIVFSLPEKPSQEILNGMAKLAFGVGNLMLKSKPQINYIVSMKPDVDFSTFGNASVVMFGKPTQNKAIDKLNNTLPQPFVSGTDALTPKNFAGRYQSGDISVGLIEAQLEPWNPFNVVTVISGTSDEGVNWALQNAGDRNMYSSMVGDVIFAHSSLINAFQSSTSYNIPLQKVLTDMTGNANSLAVVITAAPTQPGGSVAGPAAEPTAILDRYVRPVTTSPVPTGGIIALAVVIALGVLTAVFGILRTIRGGRKQ